MYESMKRYIWEDYKDHPKKSMLMAGIFCFLPGSSVSRANDLVEAGKIKKKHVYFSDEEIKRMNKEELEDHFMSSQKDTLSDAYFGEFCKCTSYAFIGGLVAMLLK